MSKQELLTSEIGLIARRRRLLMCLLPCVVVALFFLRDNSFATAWALAIAMAGLAEMSVLFRVRRLVEILAKESASEGV